MRRGKGLFPPRRSPLAARGAACPLRSPQGQATLLFGTKPLRLAHKGTKRILQVFNWQAYATPTEATTVYQCYGQCPDYGRAPSTEARFQKSDSRLARAKQLRLQVLRRKCIARQPPRACDRLLKYAKPQAHPSFSTMQGCFKQIVLN